MIGEEISSLYSFLHFHPMLCGVSMPFVENNGVKIYYEVEGKGPPLMLHSGLTGNLRLFHDFGYTGSLGRKYRLILIDARGHGKSDKPHLPESYKFETLVSDTVSVLDALGVERSHFMGYSFGGSVGLAIAKYAPDRFSSLIIGGAAAIERDSEEEIKRTQAQISVYKEGTELITQVFIKAGMPATDARARALSIDWDAMIAIKSYIEHIGYEYFLPSLRMPCLFFIGEDDSRYSSAKQTAGMIKNARFVSLPGLNHSQAFEESELVLPYILEFLADQSNP